MKKLESIKKFELLNIDLKKVRGGEPPHKTTFFTDSCTEPQKKGADYDGCTDTDI